MRLLLIILGILVILLVFLCRLRLGILAAFAAGDTTLDLRIGPASIRLYQPQPEQTKKTEEDFSRKPKKADQSKGSRGKLAKPTWTDLQDAWKTLRAPVRRALERTRRGIRVDPLNLSVTVGGAEDPAQAAESYGILEMVVWTVMPPLEQLLVIPDPHIHVGVDFDAGKTRVDGTAAVTIRLGTLLAVALGAGIPVLRWLIKYQKRKQQPPKETAPKTADARA